jgi:hypothetical protein
MCNCAGGPRTVYTSAQAHAEAIRKQEEAAVDAARQNAVSAANALANAGAR